MQTAMIPVSRPSLCDQELSNIRDVMDSAWLGQGKYVADFEKALGDYLGSPNIIAVSSGTAALHLSLEAVLSQPGDEVIVPSFTFAATIQAILMAGGRPVYCDICEDSLNIDPAHAASLISGRTKAIVPVHYMGNPCRMDEIYALAKSHGLQVVEDAAHAFGSSYHGGMIGSSGNPVCFSFDPIKNITCGEGGAIATGDNNLADKLRIKRSLGIDRGRAPGNMPGHKVTMHGYRYHLSNINAAAGLAQLQKADSFREKKLNILQEYTGAFKAIPGVTLLPYDPVNTFPFGYTFRIKNNRRDSFMDYMRSEGIETLVNYAPNHLQPFFSDGSSLPVSEKIYKEIVSLPFYVDMEAGDIRKVIDAVSSFFTH